MRWNRIDREEEKPAGLPVVVVADNMLAGLALERIVAGDTLLVVPGTVDNTEVASAVDKLLWSVVPAS